MRNLGFERWRGLGQVGKGNLCGSLGKEIYWLLEVEERCLRAVSATAAGRVAITSPNLSGLNEPKLAFHSS